MIVGIIQCTILLFISLFWFKVPFAGSFLDFYAAVFFYVLSSTGIGLCVSAISKNMQQVLVYVIVMMVPMALLSGITRAAAFSWKKLPSKESLKISTAS